MAIPHSGSEPQANVSEAPAPLILFAEGSGDITLPDAGLMFRGAYDRAGPDLTISGPAGTSVRIVDYFAHETPPTLFSPEGAMLAPDLVAQLAGPRFAGKYAQAAPSQQALPIGQVEAIGGDAVITRADGSKVAAALGTHVFQGDVVETASGARISITFTDKTVATLGEGARLVLDKFVYDPAGGQNSLLFNLVHGAFVFVAGLVAPTGDMKIQTPVATMGIRGTTGIVRADVQDGTSYFTLKPDPPGKLGGSGGGIGAFDVFARLNGALIKEVRVADQLLIVRNAAGQFQDLPQLGSNESLFQQDILSFAFSAHQMLLQRLDGGDPPVTPDAPAQPPGQRRGDINDGTQHAGLNPEDQQGGFFHAPLAIDLVKQTELLGNELLGGQAGQTGDENQVVTPNQQQIPPSFINVGKNVAPALDPTTITINDTENTHDPESIITGRLAGRDPDQGSTLTYTIVGGRPGHAPNSTVIDTAYGRLTVFSDGRYVFEPNSQAIDALNAGQHVHLEIPVTVSDGIAPPTTSKINIDLHGADDPLNLQPVTITIHDTPQPENLSPIEGRLVADRDSNANVRYAIEDGQYDEAGRMYADTPYGRLTLYPDGRYIFEPNNAAIDALRAGQDIHLRIGIWAMDGNGNISSNEIKIDIFGANEAPTVNTARIHIENETLSGAASYAGDATYVMNPEQPGQAGALWHPIDLSQSAHWNVTVYFGPGTGDVPRADGVTFAFQNLGPQALGDSGGGIGINGVPNAVGVKFDSWPTNAGDYGFDFAQFFTDGNVSQPVATFPQIPTGSLADGSQHTIEISWDPATKTLTYSLDGAITSSLVRDIVNLDFNGATNVYAGFTAAGGTAYARETLTLGSIVAGNSALIVERPGVTGSSEQRVVQGNFTFTDEVNDTHTIAVTPLSETAYGSLQVTLVSDGAGSGKVSWHYAVIDGALDGLASEQSVIETYRIAISDGAATTFTDITITLTGTSEPSGGTPASAQVSHLSLADGGISNIVFGSEGNDKIGLDLGAGSTITSTIDGRGGTNMLDLVTSGASIDLTALAGGQLKNIQEIGLAQGHAEIVQLSLDNVLELTDTASLELSQAVETYNASHPSSPIVLANKALVVTGDHGSVTDTLALSDHGGGTWGAAGNIENVHTLDGQSGTYTIYNYTTTTGDVLASVAVHSDMNVTLPMHSA